MLEQCEGDSPGNVGASAIQGWLEDIDKEEMSYISMIIKKAAF